MPKKLIARDDFSAQYISPTSRLLAALEILRQHYHFDIPRPLPEADHKNKGELSADIKTSDGQTISVRVPYDGSPLIEISSDTLLFDLEAYRQRVGRMFRTG